MTPPIEITLRLLTPFAAYLVVPNCPMSMHRAVGGTNLTPRPCPSSKIYEGLRLIQRINK